jgi:DNA invertase Pin-like site-specific DNA recombinase
MSTKGPAAYLRKSKDAATKQEHLDRLLATVRRYGHNGDTVVYDDWARSGDQRKLASRKAWREMCGAIERGEHDVVFMNDLDRGGRSLEEWLRFIRVAQDHQVRVVAADTDYSAPENKDRLIFEAWLAERELDAAKRRAAATIRMRRGRGDAMGQPPYGYRFAREDGRVVLVEDPDRPVQPVLDAVHEARGNTAEAVRLLNDRGVPSRYGREWAAPALRGFLRRLGETPPEAKKARRTRTGRMAMPQPLSKLLVCHCGQVMTPLARGDAYCYVGARMGKARHGRYIARQRHVFDFLKKELHYSRVDLRGTRTSGAGAEEQRVALEEKRRRLGVSYADGAFDDDEYARRKEAIGREIDALPEPDAWVPGPGFGKRTPIVDWSAGPDELGEQLRRVVREVRLGEDMKPVAAEWRVPWITRAKAPRGQDRGTRSASEAGS